MAKGQCCRYLLILISFVVITTTISHAQTASLTATAVNATTFTVGSAVQTTSTVTNTGTTTLSIGLRYFVIFPDGTQFEQQTRLPARSVTPGAKYTNVRDTTTSIFSGQTGAVTLQIAAFDNTTNTQLAVVNLGLNVLPLPTTSVVVPHFTEVASSAGVAAPLIDLGKVCLKNIGTGAGWGDYDGDGHLDLLVTNWDGPQHLYHNNGDGTFTDVTAAAGIPSMPHAAGVAWADYNNDGFEDVVVVSDGRTYLLQNNGNGTFTDVTAAAGLLNQSGRGESAAWGDFDGDGYLDLYIVNYGACATGQFASHLYHNNGNGTFTDVTNYLGGVTAKQVTGFGFAAIWFDYNGDGRPDLYIVNDRGSAFEPNVLWRNDGPDGLGGWIFTDVSAQTGANVKIDGMGVALGDIDNSGNFDLAASNIGVNILLKWNPTTGKFAQYQGTAGTDRESVATDTRSVTWGMGFYDFNNDGYQDLYIAAGRGSDANATLTNVQPDALFVNNWGGHLTGVANDGIFLDLTSLTGASDLNLSRTAAFADYNEDGWMDIFVANANQTPRLYRNDSGLSGNTNGWLEVKLVGACMKCTPVIPNTLASNRDGIGAKLTLTAGGMNQYRQIFSGSSLGAGDMITAHFGLGSATIVDSLQIRWPSGIVQTLVNLPINQKIVVQEP